MKKFLIIVVSILTVTAGCTDNDDVDGVNIRVRNTNAFAYDTVQVGGEDKIHTDVAAGADSQYLQYQTAYAYAYIKIEAEGETYVLQPIDFVGETPLENGFYTYILAVDAEGNVGLNFEVD